jgi:hypothetical protein
MNDREAPSFWSTGPISQEEYFNETKHNEVWRSGGALCMLLACLVVSKVGS